MASNSENVSIWWRHHFSELTKTSFATCSWGTYRKLFEGFRLESILNNKCTREIWLLVACSVKSLFVRPSGRWQLGIIEWQLDDETMNVGQASPQVHLICKINAVRCRYNALNFLKFHHCRHPKARPLGRVMECLLWVSSLIHVLLLSLKWCV